MTEIEYAPGSMLQKNRMFDCPLWWHTKGLSQTASGYGKKLTTRYKITHRGRLYRIYATCYSNAASHYIIVKGKNLYLR